MIRISVIVPTYNEEKNIVNCMEAISRQTLPRKEYEIIIVDGPSKDRTKELAKRYVDKFIIQKSKGISGARNDGVRIAKGPIIATTDADCIVPKDWLERILKNLEDKRYIAVCGSDGPIEKNLKARTLYFFLKNIIHLLSFFKIYCLGGTNSAFRKREFMKIGGYKNLAYSDDADLGIRLKKIGKIKYDRGMHVKLSVRRLEKNGYIKTLLTWLSGDLRLLLGLSIPKKQYARQKYS
jgi:cellulose synthase/poly-beta-1,6-N-acetylglucosamine synthase-like glycosyltransferase